MCSTSDCRLHLYPSSLKEASSQEESDSVFTAASWRVRADRVSDHDPLSSSTEQSESSSIQLRIPTWTVGKLSVCILLFAFCADYCVCRLQSYGGTDSYEASGGTVYNNNNKQRQRVSLGSAAISSVTESLAPILPFTGGLDLRREDYWATTGTWYERLQSVAQQVQDAFSPEQIDVEEDANGFSSSSTVSKLQTRNTSKRKPVTHISTISAQQPFVAVDEIADLTLSDVSEAFRYAMEANKPGFNDARFINSLSTRVKRVLLHMNEAVAKSRGKDTKISVADPNGFGQTDALLFCAAMRIFAEWRVVRQVPEGYKGFAVGMSLGHKDIVQNVAKIESTAHALLNYRRDLLALQAQWEENGAYENCPIDGSAPRCLRSPTIQEVMQYEIDMDINPSNRLPRLKDKSGSMGILWTRRQLHYQTLLLDNVLKVPNKFPSTASAVLAAYNSVYDQFHGWAVQKIFNYSFQSAPEAEEIFKHMNPHRLREAKHEAVKSVSGGSLRDERSQESASSKEDRNPLLSFFKNVENEWDKLVTNIVRVFDKNHMASSLGASGSGSETIDSFAVDKFVTDAMVKDAHERIPAYLQIIYPVLDDLALTFNNLNMDDPTRV